MAKVNRGKQFEEQIREAFNKLPNTSVIRLIDPQNGYAGVRNICDFVVYQYPFQYLLECKSHYGNTLPFVCITDNQWQGLLDISHNRGVIAGVMVWFIDHDDTLFIPIRALENLKQLGAKSFNYTLHKDMAIKIDGTKKRILFEYDMNSFIDYCNSHPSLSAT